MTWDAEALLAGRAILAALLGGAIGFERKRDGPEHYAGIRTFAAVSLGSCVFSLVSGNLPGAGNADRIAAQVVTGIGFIGAGLIMREGGQVKGLTTAASLWATASVGMAVAYGMFILAILSTATVYLLLDAHRWPVWKWISPPRTLAPPPEPPKEAP